MKAALGKEQLLGVQNTTKMLLVLELTEMRERLPTWTLTQVDVQPMQVQFASTKQELEHPSPLFVLLSSHSSPPVMTPFPQMVLKQTEGRPLQKQLDSIRQDEEHPSSLTVLPSSQVSPASCFLLPQVGEMQVWLMIEEGQVQLQPLYTNPPEQTEQESLLLELTLSPKQERQEPLTRRQLFLQLVRLSRGQHVSLPRLNKLVFVQTMQREFTRLQPELQRHELLTLSQVQTEEHTDMHLVAFIANPLEQMHLLVVIENYWFQGQAVEALMAGVLAGVGCGEGEKGLPRETIDKQLLVRLTQPSLQRHLLLMSMLLLICEQLAWTGEEGVISRGGEATAERFSALEIESLSSLLVVLDGGTVVFTFDVLVGVRVVLAVELGEVLVESLV